MHPSQVLAIISGNRRRAVAIAALAVILAILAVDLYLQVRTGAILATHYFGGPVRTRYSG